MEKRPENAALGPNVRLQPVLDEFAQIHVETNFHTKWSSCPLQYHSEVSQGDVWPPHYLLSSCCSCRQQPKTKGESQVHELGMWLPNPLCNVYHNRAFQGGIRRIFVAVVDIELNVENLERWQHYAGRAITGRLQTTPGEVILAEENLPSIKTWDIMTMSTITMKKSLRTMATNLWHTTATQWVHHHTQTTSWREKQVIFCKKT